MAKVESAAKGRARRPCSFREATIPPSPSTTTCRSSARRARRFPRRDSAFLHGVRDPDHGRRLAAVHARGAGPPQATRADARCPAAAPRCSRSVCASASSPRRAAPRAWLDVHREAHRQGFKSTATMMYGHVETPDDILDHLDAIRDLQDEHGGFTAFVPWSFKPGNTLLEKWIKHYQGPNAYLRMLAVSRLYLDNFPHVQASWFSEGKRAGQVALSLGRGRLRGDPLRGERPRRGRLREQDHGGRDRDADPRSGLHAGSADHASTRSSRSTDGAGRCAPTASPLRGEGTQIGSTGGASGIRPFACAIRIEPLEGAARPSSPSRYRVVVHVHEHERRHVSLSMPRPYRMAYSRPRPRGRRHSRWSRAAPARAGGARPPPGRGASR